MIAVDTNILVYAHREDSPWFEPAIRQISALAEGPAAWAIPWPCVHEFFGIVTHPRRYSPPTPLAAAVAQIEAWLDSPGLLLLTESAQHFATLRAQIVSGRVVGPLVHDARIASICLDHGVAELWTADRDFTRFPGLRTRNPLIS